MKRAIQRCRPSGATIPRCRRPSYTRLLATTASSSSTSPPQLIDFGRGQPAPSLLPFELLHDCAVPGLAADLRELHAQGRAGCLGYGEERGSARFRGRFADFLAAQAGHDVDPNSLFMTNGASQGLQMVLDLFTQQGDTIFVENPTYFLALAILKGRGLNIVGVNTDENGMDIDDLESKLQLYGKHNIKPPLVYVIPSFNNPTSATLTVERRKKLLELSRRTKVKVVSDEVYQFLYFDPKHQPPPSLYHLAQQEGEDHNVIAINSFSKIVAPGLRLGWMQASEPLLSQLEDYGPIQSGGGLNPLVLQIMENALKATDGRGNSLFARHLGYLRKTYAHLSDTLCDSLESCLPTAPLSTSLPSSSSLVQSRGIRFDRPKGGYFVWIRLPDIVSKTHIPQGTKETSPYGVFARLCREAGVGYKPGHLFATPPLPVADTSSTSTAPHPPSKTFEEFARLSFAYYSVEEIKVGVQRLAGIINNMKG